jgi:hypothetical protein
MSSLPIAHSRSQPPTARRLGFGGDFVAQAFFQILNAGFHHQPRVVTQQQ